MTYCLGIMTRRGLVMASDSRSNAGYDQVNVCRKMYTFVQPGSRVFIVLASGNLSLTQSVATLLRRDFDRGQGLAAADNFYDAARAAGEQIRRVSELDRAALERDEFRFNVHLLLGGQIRGEVHNLCMIYPQGNPLFATEDSPFLQIGECKYGRPILDRGVRYDSTSLEEAAKYALLSLDSTMRSNVTVGPPVDLLVYGRDELQISRYRRFDDKDQDLRDIHTRWEHALRKGVLELPEVRFHTPDGGRTPPPDGIDRSPDAGLTERVL
jgi:putative proteasome-type protease